MRKVNHGDKEHKITYVALTKERFGNGCHHSIVLTDGRTELMPPSSSVVGLCRCLRCGGSI